MISKHVRRVEGPTDELGGINYCVIQNVMDASKEIGTTGLYYLITKTKLQLS